MFCPWVLRVWSNPQINLPIQTQHIRNITTWIIEHAGDQKPLPGLPVIATVLWHIWKARNAFIFGRKHPDPHRVAEEAMLQSRVDSTVARSSTCNAALFQHHRTIWRPPAPGGLKVHFDGSYQLGSREGTMACVCRDSQGQLTGGFSDSFAAFSALQAEIHA